MKAIPFQYAQFQQAYKKFQRKIDLKNKKTASYFTITFTFIVLSFFGIFAIKPTLTTATSLIKNVDDLKKINIDYENKISSLIAAQAEYEKIRDDLPLIESAMPNNANFSKLAKTLERFAYQENIYISQLQIDSVPISTPSSKNKMEQYGFGIVVSGEYSSLTSFISHLINWRRIVTIKTLDFTQEGGTASAAIRLTLKGITYYEP